MSDNQLRLTVTQFRPTPNPTENLELVLKLIHESSSDQPDLISIPENFLRLGTPEAMREAAQSLAGPAVSAVRKAAKQVRSAVFLGGFKRFVGEKERLRNSAVLVDASGQIAAVYDKIHLFDANIGDQTYMASAIEDPGSTTMVAMLREVGLGLSICYDVRFPELYRSMALAGAAIFLIPAAFLASTGKHHWEALLRARAIENAAYVVAPALIGGERGVFDAYGHAMVVDPWGRVLVDLEESEYALKTLALDLDAVSDARGRLPVLKQLQPHAYANPVKLVEVPTVPDLTTEVAS